MSATKMLWTLQVAGLDSHIRIDGFTMDQSLEPPIDTWTVTIDHEAPQGVPVLLRAKRWVWVRRHPTQYDEGVVMASAELPIGWDAVEPGDRFHVTICYDAYAVEDEADSPPPRRTRAGARA